jgi:hypothetical protein
MVRLHAVEALQERIGRELNSRHLGEELEVLVEGRERGKWMGRTRTNKILFFSTADADTTDRTGQLVMVKVEETGPWSMQGSFARLIHDAPQALKDLLQAKTRRFDTPRPNTFLPIRNVISQKIPPTAHN